MIKLDCWLPQKEMFGRFSLDSIAAEGNSLKVIVSNEVFQFSITFTSGVGAHSVTEIARCTQRLDALNANYEVLMRGNSFFKLTGSPYLEEFGKENDVHYVIVATNAVVDILSGGCSTVVLTQAKKR